MRKIFVQKGMESKIMDRLCELKDMIKLYRYGIAHRSALKNYRTALQAYEVSEKEVSEWKANKLKLRRRNEKIKEEMIEWLLKR